MTKWLRIRHKKENEKKWHIWHALVNWDLKLTPAGQAGKWVGKQISCSPKQKKVPNYRFIQIHYHLGLIFLVWAIHSEYLQSWGLALWHIEFGFLKCSSIFQKRKTKIQQKHIHINQPLPLDITPTHQTHYRIDITTYEINSKHYLKNAHACLSPRATW